MNEKALALYEKLKAEGIAPEQDELMRRELAIDGEHDIPIQEGTGGEGLAIGPGTIYAWNDLSLLQAITALQTTYVSRVRSVDELLERDALREKDGFPRKIQVGRLIKPGRGGKDKVVVVPTTVEEKLIHDRVQIPEEGEGGGGSGDGEEGEVIGEQQVHEEGRSGSGPGQGEGAGHEIESSAYDLGKILTEQFKLPNLKDKGKKRSFTRYSYDLTDRHLGRGQILDKKATLREIVQTNITLGNLPDPSAIDPSSFIIGPKDKVYRVLSREKDYESQAMIFFLRDYSGSMGGKPTELVVSQHVLLYSWLLYQYARQVESRFILHDTEAKEVPDFYTYYNSNVAGGTQVSSAYKLVNEIVAKENLAQDYNIYVFHGTDGDDWDTEGKESLPEVQKMLTYVSRFGVTIAENGYGKSGVPTTVENYFNKSKLLTEKPNLVRLDVLKPDSDEPRLIDGIRKLIS